MAVIVKARQNETIDSLLRRFRYAVADEGLLDNLEKRRFFEKPGVTRMKKEKELSKRFRRQFKNQYEI